MEPREPASAYPSSGEFILASRQNELACALNASFFIMPPPWTSCCCITTTEEERPKSEAEKSERRRE